MKAVSKSICMKISGCPAYSCDDANCAGKNITTHKPPPIENGIGEQHNHRWYYGKRWKVIRLGQLSRQPLCQRCLVFDCVTAGNHVDHVMAHQGDAVLFFDRDNLQTLCVSCHSTKTASERRGEVLDYRSGEEVTW